MTNYTFKWLCDELHGKNFEPTGTVFHSARTGRIDYVVRTIAGVPEVYFRARIYKGTPVLWREFFTLQEAAAYLGID